MKYASTNVRMAIYLDNIKIWLKANTNINLLEIESLLAKHINLIEAMFFNGIDPEKAAGTLSML